MAQSPVKYKVVVIGGSAGSLDVILKVMPDLPADHDIIYIIVVHRKNSADSIFTEILSRKTTMDVREVEDKDAILPNVIYAAPPDYHLLVEDISTFSLDVSEKINHSRPSIDVTFESVAEVFGKTCIAVLLSGANADGAVGLKKVRLLGGVSIVEDPATASVAYMPQKALEESEVDLVVSADNLSRTLINLITRV